MTDTSSAREQIAHLVVCRLREILVPKADGVKRLWRDGANDVVDYFSQLIARLGRGDGNGHDDAARTLLFQGFNGRVHRGPGRKPVIHEDHSPATHVGGRTIASVQALATLQLLLLSGGYCVNHRWRDS
jgi:hypothetical protein